MEAAPTEYAADGRSASKRARRAAVDYGRLADAMRASRRVLRHFREERVSAVRQFVGRRYASGGAEKAVPVNLLARYVQTVARSLVPNNPRVMLTARSRDDGPAVSAMQDWVNRRFVGQKLQETLQRWVVDALFSVGVMKVGIASPADSAMNGYYSPAGQPFAETIDLDDLVFDPMCRDFRQASFIGHRFRVPLEVARKIDHWDAKGRKLLEAASAAGSAGRLNEGDGDERAWVVGAGWEGGGEREFEPTVELWEVYFPRLKLVAVLPGQSGGTPPGDVRPLHEHEWVGPACGPYHFLGYNTVPGNPMPKAPVHDLIELHEAINKSYRKLIRQLERQKEVLPASGAQLDDAKQIIQASDGEIIGVDNAESARPVSFGGPNPVTAQFTVHLADLFSKQAGNLDLMSGAAPQSRTATQDKILAANSSAAVGDMQERTVSGVADVCRSLCWFWWYHPTEEMAVPRAAPGVPDVSITRRLQPGGSDGPGLKRNGRFEDLGLRIDPYSLQYRTPSERLQFINSVVQQMLPIMPLLQQQGVVFDAQAYLKKIAEYADEPDVTALFTVAEPPGGGGAEAAPTDRVRVPKAANTSREYVRRSVGADTQDSRAADMERASLEAASTQGQ